MQDGVEVFSRPSRTAVYAGRNSGEVLAWRARHLSATSCGSLTDDPIVSRRRRWNGKIYIGSACGSIAWLYVYGLDELNEDSGAG